MPYSDRFCPSCLPIFLSLFFHSVTNAFLFGVLSPLPISSLGEEARDSLGTAQPSLMPALMPKEIAHLRARTSRFQQLVGSKHSEAGWGRNQASQ